MNKQLSEYISDLYRVVPIRGAGSRHFSGGQPDVAGAICPNCHIPLLQLWNIDCSDPLFQETTFGPWVRLPLLFCWGCVNDVYYMPSTSGAIRVFPLENGYGQECSFPYGNYPSFYERQSISLESGIPDDVKVIARRMIEEWASDDDDEAAIWEPSDDEQRKLTGYFGHPVRSTFCLTHHQFGGHTLAPSWHDDDYSCPNPDCESGTKSEKKMVFLARVLNAPHHGLPMVEPFVSNDPASYNYDVAAQFHICESCFTLVGSNRTD